MEKKGREIQQDNMQIVYRQESINLNILLEIASWEESLSPTPVDTTFDDD